jgi:predicted O-methyltransferase YrrM
LALLTAVRETGGKLISVEIDPEWAQDATDRVHAAGLGEWWELHIMSSNDLHIRLGNIELDMLWIDGAHEEEFVRADFDHYAPRVRQGGFILMHDYWQNLDPTDSNGPSETGVTAVVESARRTNKYEVLTLPWSHGLSMLRVL